MIVTTLAPQLSLNVPKQGERTTFLAAPNTTAAVLSTTMMGMVVVAHLTPQFSVLLQPLRTDFGLTAVALHQAVLVGFQIFRPT